MDIKLKNIELSYNSLFEAKESLIKNKKLFTALLLIPKSDVEQTELLKSAIETIAKENNFKTYTSPLKDGDSTKNARGETIDPYFPGYFYMNVSSGENYPPVLHRVVQGEKRTIRTIDRTSLDKADKEAFQKGAKVAVRLNLKPYEMAHKGVTAYLSEIAQTAPGAGNFKEFLYELGLSDEEGIPENSILNEI